MNEIISRHAAQAAEDIENLTLGVLTKDGIRKIQDAQELYEGVIVLVNNAIPANSPHNFTIKQGQMIRYKWISLN